MRFGPFSCPVEAGKILSQLHEEGVEANLVADSAVFGLVNYFIEVAESAELNQAQRIIQEAMIPEGGAGAEANERREVVEPPREPGFFRDLALFGLLAAVLFVILVAPLDLLPLFGHGYYAEQLYLGDKAYHYPKVESPNLGLQVLNSSIYSILVFFISAVGLILLGGGNPFREDRDFHPANALSLFAIPVLIFLDSELMKFWTPEEIGHLAELSKALMDLLGPIRSSFLQGLFWLSFYFLIFGVVYQLLRSRHSKLSAGMIMTCCAFILFFHVQEITGYILSFLYFAGFSAIRIFTPSLKVFLAMTFLSILLFNNFNLYSL